MQNLEKRSNADFNLNLHPRQNAQSTSLSGTNGETGTEGKQTGTDENQTIKDGTGPFSEHDGWSGSQASDDIAVDFGEDPIEKTRQTRRGIVHTQRVLPDRAQMEEIRE